MYAFFFRGTHRSRMPSHQRRPLSNSSRHNTFYCVEQVVLGSTDGDWLDWDNFGSKDWPDGYLIIVSVPLSITHWVILMPFGTLL